MCAANESGTVLVVRWRQLGGLVRSYGFDVLIVVAATWSAIEIATAGGGSGAPSVSPWFGVPAILLVLLPLLARRRFPFAAPATTLLVAAALSFVDGRLVVYSSAAYLAGIAAAFLLGNVGDSGRAWIGLVVATGAVAVVVANDPRHSPGDLVATTVLYGIAWLAGYVLRDRGERAHAAEERAARLERERELDALRAVVDERTRIARELHDVIGHSVSVMTVQAAGVRRLLRPEQEREREALLAVEATGRRALAEMRQVVGALRDPGESPALEPQPGLAGVDELVARARDTGLAVDLEIEGDPVLLPAGVDLTAYRIVQEGLTNTIKHAGAHQAAVRVSYIGDHVEIEVRDDGRGVDVGDSTANGGGRGLIGMRERVSVFGGELDAGPLPAGGYRLRARLPVSV
jgi:signal transduction histidine kinase